MTPHFPKFKFLELSDEVAIRDVTYKHPPYSDYDFTSMWSWNLKGQMMVSHLYGNLVVKFADYVTGSPFYSFLGTRKVDATARTLLDHSADEGLPQILKIIPEISAQKLDRELFVVAEDADHADYVLAVEKLSSYDGPELAGKRRAVSQFLRRTPVFRFEVLNLESPQVDADIRALFSLWLVQKNVATIYEEEHEYVALRRCLESPLAKNLLATGVYVDDQLAAFWLIGLPGNGYAVSHFEKAATIAHGSIFPFLKQKTGELLAQKGIMYINLEQDLGIAGLRTSKTSYFPQQFLRKYSVRSAGHKSL